MAMNGKSAPPDEIEALLPWSATGRLGADDSAKVAAAAAAREDIRLQLHLIEEDRSATVALNEDLGVPSRQAWDRITAAVEAGPRREPLASRLFHEIFAGPGSTLRRLAFAAAALVIAVETAALVEFRPSATAGGGFETASVSSSPSAGPVELIVFAPEARIDQVAAWLGAMQGKIVDGPRGGFYKVRFGDRALQGAELDVLMGRIHASSLVRQALSGKS
jgi:hypothetical protein